MRLTNYLIRSANNWCFQRHRDDVISSQVQWEIMGVPFMHHFHTKTLAVQDVSPSVDDVSVTAHNRLVKIETVEVESHCGYTEGGKPNANHGPSSKKEMEAAAIVK